MNAIPVVDMAVQLRRNAGLSVKDLQSVFGFSTPQAIYKWQRGTAMPTVDNLVVLSAVFGVTIDNILVLRNLTAVTATA